MPARRFSDPIRLFLPALFALVLAACDGDSAGAPASNPPPDHEEPTPASVVVTAPATLSVGDTVLVANAYFVPPVEEGNFAPIPAAPV